MTSLTIITTEANPVPPLSISPLFTSPTQTLALKLLVDSLAQERQTTAATIILHPRNLSLLLSLLSLLHAVTVRLFLPFHTAVLVHAGAVLAYLLYARWVTGPFLWRAEDFRCDEFLRGPLGPDTLIGAQFGGEMVGAIVVRGLPDADDAMKKTKERKRSKRIVKAEIRGWTTMLRYRNKGLGRDLVREAIVYVRSEFGKDVEIGFAEDHLNAGRFVTARYMVSLDRREAMAARVLREELKKVEV